MKKIRTFIAIELPSAVINRAADLIERLRVVDVKVTWVASQNMHLTLKFLGDVGDKETPDVCRAVAEAVKPIAPFGISLVGAGAFPDTRRPRTAWIGVDRGVDELRSLLASVDKSLKKLGFPKEKRTFHPHLTIGRIRQGGSAACELGELLRKHDSFDAGAATVSQVVVFASFLGKTGPTYEAMGRADLCGK